MKKLIIAGLAVSAAVSAFAAATNLALAAGAKLNLGFSGVQTVRRLTVNGHERRAGDYSVASGKTLDGRLSGSGTLRVLEGIDRGLGLSIIVR